MDSIDNINDEPEELPKWMRYMPKSKLFLNAQPSIVTNITPTEETVVEIEAKQKKGWKRVILKRSCNPFGPTSTHAITVESELKKEKRKRNVEEDQDDDENMIYETENPVRKSITERRKVRCKVTNISEAAELFSIVKLK